MTDVSAATILLVNNFPGPGIGGGEVNTLRIARGARDAGMYVSIACVPEAPLAGVAYTEGFAVHEIPMDGARIRSSARGLEKLIVETQPDIVQGTGFLTNALSRTAAANLDVIVIDTVQADPDAPRLEGASRLVMGYRKKVHRRSAMRADAVVAVSSSVADTAVAWGSPKDRVHVIPNGIDTESVRAAASGSLPAEIPASLPVVGMVGRLEPIKGAQYFVRAAGTLKRGGANASFVVAGTGSLESRLRELATAHGLADDLTFLGNVSPIEPLLARIDVLVMPSLSEGLPIVALEAMALETPVVGSGAGGISEVVDSGVTGLLVEPHDVDALARSVKVLLDDPDRAAAMGRAGRTRVEERFAAQGMVRAYVGLYAELLETRDG